jgi:hypothetical protein
MGLEKKEPSTKFKAISKLKSYIKLVKETRDLVAN